MTNPLLRLAIAHTRTAEGRLIEIKPLSTPDSLEEFTLPHSKVTAVLLEGRDDVIALRDALNAYLGV